VNIHINYWFVLIVSSILGHIIYSKEGIIVYGIMGMFHIMVFCCDFFAYKICGEGIWLYN